MRKKLNPTEKRNRKVTIKIKDEMYLKLKYLAGLDGKPISTFINNLLSEDVETCFNAKQINWNKLSPEERGEINDVE